MRYLLVDRIERIQAGTSIEGWKNVAMSEDFLEWHFPERPVVPGTVVLEAFAQLAGWLEASSSSFERWFLLDRVASARYFGLAVPGDRIVLRLDAVPAADPGRRAYRGESQVAGERKAAVEFEGVVVPLDSLDDRDRARRAFETLRGAPPSPAPDARRGKP